MSPYDSPRNNKVIWITAAALVILLILAKRGLIDTRVKPEAPATARVKESVTEPIERDNRRSAIPQSSTVARRRSITSNSADSTRAQNVQRPLTGFIVDDFRSWSSIPNGYHAEGIAVANGAIGLADSGTSGSRAGVITSPRLELWQPALSAPAASRVVPEGCEVRAEIALSSDGKTWGGWIPIEQNHPPDGRQVQPLSAPAWSGSRPAPQSLSLNSSETSGPYIRYRLTLTSQSSASPVVEDLRIWHNPRP